MGLILLPGLGGDQRQFEPQRAAFPDLLVPPWIVPKRRESLPAYAARLADTIPPVRPMVLGGSSFGGMVAYEMAGHLRPAAVVLIGSCRSPRALRPMLRRLRPLAPGIPVQVLALAQWMSPVGARMFSSLPPEQRALCVAMFKEMDCGFMKWVCRAILGWRPDEPPPVAVFQIHGQKDRVMPVRLAEADEVIPEGGHLINLTHAQQVNAFLRKAVESVQ
jgi:pimeloyl-ACP methyl ester carboxylesterase